MYLPIREVILSAQVFFVILVTAQIATSDDARNLQNHRNGILSYKDIADHWIGYPKNPYTSFSVTVNPPTAPSTPPTSAPLSTTKITKQKKKKQKKSFNKKRRYDSGDDSDYRESQRSRERSTYQDFEYDYDGPLDGPSYGDTHEPSPLMFRASASTPKAMMVSPSISTNSKMVKAIYAGIPKIATYVVPKAKKYVVQKAEAIYAPSAFVPPSPSMYASASNAGMRRLDPSFDYEDNGNRNSFLGPQDSFPPRPVLNKITQAGQRQPCHGPECHQHHKGLVRFYWRRVVYPRRNRARGRARARRPRGRNARRRLRGGARQPSDQNDVYYADDDDGADENEEDTNANDNNEEEEEEEEVEEEDNEENDSSRRNTWQPGKAYGHDFNEGTNYGDQERRVYRDKRFTYKNDRKRRRGSAPNMF